MLMGNPRLTVEQLEIVRALLVEIRAKLNVVSGGDADLLFAFRRKVYKELVYDERSKPAVRKRLKAVKRLEQGGKCPKCKKPLPERYVVLDRLHAVSGYTPENTRLICQECDITIQTERRFQ